MLYSRVHNAVVTLVHCSTRSTLVDLSDLVHGSLWSMMDSYIRSTLVYSLLQSNPVQSNLVYFSSSSNLVHFNPVHSPLQSHSTTVHSDLKSTPIHNILRSAIQSMVHSTSQSTAAVHFNTLFPVHGSGLRSTLVDLYPLWSTLEKFCPFHHSPLHDALQSVKCGP